MPCELWGLSEVTCQSTLESTGIGACPVRRMMTMTKLVFRGKLFEGCRDGSGEMDSFSLHRVVESGSRCGFL